MIEPVVRPGTAPTWLGRATPLITFVVLGLPAGAVGVAWPPMRATFGAPLAGLGLLLAAVTIAYAAGTASSGPLGARLGGATLVAAGCLLAAVGLFGLSLAPAWWIVPILGLPIGAGAGFIDGAVNTYASLTRGIRYMGWLHASWAIGAAVAPQLVITSLALTASWRPAFAFAATCFLACGAGVIARRREWVSPSGHRDRPQHRASAQPGRLASYLRPVVFLAVVLLLAAGLEATAGDWSYTQLTLGRSMGSTAASWGATLFWTGLAGGRVALGIAGNRLPPIRLLDWAIVLSALAALIYWLGPSLLAAFVGLPLLGLAVSVIYPLLMSLTPARVGAGLTGYAIGFGLAAGTVGGGALPAAIGLLLQGVGLYTLGPVLAIMAMSLLILHAVSRDAPRSVQPASGQPAS